MSRAFSVGEVKAEKGTKASGFLTVQDDDAGTVNLLVNVINGATDGPVVAVTGGMFGTQYAGIDACIRVYNEIDPKKLNGTLIIVPVMEMPAFQKGVDRSPIDGLTLRTSFPGDPNGTITRRIAHTIFNEIIKKVQYHLDLRGGDLEEAEDDFVFASETGNKDLDDENEAIAKVLGVKYYFIGTYPRGNLDVEAGVIGVRSLTLLAYKGLGSFDEEDVEKCKRGTYNLLKHLKMMEGKPDIGHPPKKMLPRQHSQPVHAKQGGLLYLDVKYGDKVSKGQKLGEIRDLKGETLEVFTSNIDGIALATWPKHIKQPGEVVMYIYALSPVP
jgi:predicted deacylase